MADKASMSGMPLRPDNAIFSASAVASWQATVKKVEKLLAEPKNKQSTSSKCHTVNVINNTGYNLEIFSPVILSELVIGSGSAEVEMVKQLKSTIYEISIPVADGTDDVVSGTVVILQQALLNGSTGKAAISGETPVRLVVMDDSHTHCRAESGNGNSLLTALDGNIPIIWKAGGTGGTDDSWGTILLGGGGSGSQAANIQAAVVKPTEFIGELPDSGTVGTWYYGQAIEYDETYHPMNWFTILINNLDFNNPLVLDEYYPGVYANQVWQEVGAYEGVPIFAVRHGGGLDEFDFICTDLVTNVQCINGNIVPTILENVMIPVMSGVCTGATGGT
jgi:hypothetical protein